MGQKGSYRRAIDWNIPEEYESSRAGWKSKALIQEFGTAAGKWITAQCLAVKNRTTAQLTTMEERQSGVCKATRRNGCSAAAVLRNAERAINESAGVTCEQGASHNEGTYSRPMTTARPPQD